jgi:fumarylacetoacetase
MSLGRSTWKKEREFLSRILSVQEGVLRDNSSLQSKAFANLSDVEMVLPVNIGNYTDFYASKEHATNIGTMWRGKENALMPNW